MSPEQDPIVAAALSRGFLTVEQLQEATGLEQSLAAEGRSPGLRALLAQRFLRPEQVDALRRSEGATRTYDAARVEAPEETRVDAREATGTRVDAREATRADTREATRADAPLLRRPLELGPGAEVSNYVIDGLLGKGGMGAVYAGHDPSSGMKVAIKVLTAGDRKAHERFRREGIAQAAADRHPNVARVFATGEHQGAPFLVMELAEGGDLLARLKAGPLAGQEAARLVAALARGLAHVHGKGILHRDLKPANVLFDEAGTPKLVDFGIARLGGEQSLTRTGDLVGTPAYMAPEQAEGAKEAVDERTDVYGLGAILYHAVTGRPPFVGDGVQVIKQVLMDAPHAPSRLVPGLSREVEHVVLKALSKDPADRYPGAGALADDLERLARGEPVLGRDEAGARRRARRARRAAGLAALAAGLVVGGVALWRTWPRLAAYFAPLPAPTASAPPRGSIGWVHTKTETRVAWASVSARVDATARAARVVVVAGGDPVPLARDAGGWRYDGRVDLKLGPNVVRLEAQADEGPRWSKLAELSVKRLPQFSPPPPERVVDRKGREITFDEAREEYVAADGSVLLYVPPMRFWLGSDDCEYRMELGGLLDRSMTKVSAPVHEVTLTRGFLVGKHEVSWGRFARYWLQAREADPPPRRRSSWGDDLPAASISFADAEAYCEWAGLELPSEVQWELAARGADQRAYPWGDAAPSATSPRASFDPLWREDVKRPGHQPLPPRPVDDATLDGASWVGGLHMAGNVWEWTQDVFTPTYDMLKGMGVGSVDRCYRAPDDPPHALRVIRGGSWRSPLSDCHAANRQPRAGDLGADQHDGSRTPYGDSDFDVGFRVVLTLPPP